MIGMVNCIYLMITVLMGELDTTQLSKGSFNSWLLVCFAAIEYIEFNHKHKHHHIC